MNQYISGDLGASFAPHGNDLYVVIGIGCNKVEPIIYDVIKGNEIEKVKRELNLIDLENVPGDSKLLKQAENWEDYHDPETIMAFGIEENVYQKIFFSGNIGSRMFCGCTDFTILIINKGAYKNMIELMAEVHSFII